MSNACKDDDATVPNSWSANFWAFRQYIATKTPIY
jgi:hypothetical protein